MHRIGLQGRVSQQLADAVVVQHQSVLLCQLLVEGGAIGKQGFSGHPDKQDLGPAPLHRLYHGSEIGLEGRLPAATQDVVAPLQQDDQSGSVPGQQPGQAGPAGLAQLSGHPAIDHGMAAQVRQHAGVALGRAHPAPLGQTVPEGEQGLPLGQRSEGRLPAGRQQQAEQPRHARFRQRPPVCHERLLDSFVTI